MRIERCANHDGVRLHRRKELPAADDRAAEHIAVTGGVLRQAVHEQVDVELTMVVKACECIVEQSERAMRASRCSDARDIGNLEDGVAGRLEDDDPVGVLARVRSIEAVSSIDSMV